MDQNTPEITQHGDTPLDEIAPSGESGKLHPEVASRVVDIRAQMGIPTALTRSGAYLHEVQIPPKNHTRLAEEDPIDWLDWLQAA